MFLALAIKNLRVLYIDDITNFKDSIEKIFGRTDQFSNNEIAIFKRRPIIEKMGR